MSVLAAGPEALAVRLDDPVEVATDGPVAVVVPAILGQDMEAVLDLVLAAGRVTLDLVAPVVPAIPDQVAAVGHRGQLDALAGRVVGPVTLDRA